MTSPGLRQLLGGRGLRLVRELGAFGVVGGVAFLVDLGLFQWLYAVLGVGAVTAKLASTLVSMSVAYVGHRFWSFAHRDATPGGRGYLLFAVINGLTLGLGLAGVALVRYGLGHESPLVLQLTNVATIALGTLIRYFAYRRWVFPAYEAGSRTQQLSGVPAERAPLPDNDGLSPSRPAWQEST